MVSFGEALKRERESRQISLREISEATKINIRYLEALEEDRFKSLPGGIFTRGFIRAYATFIGIDPEKTVGKYLAETGEDGQASALPAIPNRSPIPPRDAQIDPQVPRPVVQPHGEADISS